MDPAPFPPRATIDEKLGRMAEMLQSIADEEPGTRRRLRELRASPAYLEAYEAPQPLVTVVIPTYTSYETLRDVALPSVLAQTYPKLEVVVVGDAAPPETAAAIASLGDDRVRYENLPYRGPYPNASRRAWLVSGTPPYNAAVALARGAWIAPLGDDDAFMPDHLERLLAQARERRLELVYARLLKRMPDSDDVAIGTFPPEHGQFGLQGALYHAGLSFMELQLSDELYGVPSDWSLCRRMLRAGVRIGMLDDATVEYFPADVWGRREPTPPVAPEPPVGEPPVDEEIARERERAEDLARRLEEVTTSRSWRLTAPLRASGRRLRSWTARS